MRRATCFVVLVAERDERKRRHVTFRPAGPLRGRARAPGDKSITQRALLIAAVCEGRGAIRKPSGAPAGTNCLGFSRHFPRVSHRGHAVM